ncbi:MFS transporter [Actinospongicola halichondriae]|uniref:MFS transporter n=1 Tax=Actinospongicola halichondriae TaxID=3236844 RepID=UPI003D3E2458
MNVAFRVAFRRLFAARLLGTVSLRFAYPFLPTIADGLGTDLATIGVGVAGGEIAGLLAPLIGRRLDRIGRRRGMTDGLVVSAAGCVGVALAPHVAVFGVALFFVAIGRYLFDVSFGAWIGDEVPFERRGRALGLGELTWSGAFLLGVPVAGLLASVTTWRVPYALSAVILLASIPVVRATLETKVAGAKNTKPAAGHARPTWLHAAVFALSLGAALFFVTEGAFFETDLGMSDRTISAVVILLGVGEVIGSLLSAFLADRVGKRVAVMAGIVVLVPAALGFSLAGSLDAVGIAAALAVGLGFELAFVSALPLVVEVDESHRAAAMGLAVAGLTGARTLAAVVGTRLFAEHGIDAVVLVSVPALVVAFGVVLLRVREPAQ